MQFIFSRMTTAFFAISGLDVLNSLNGYEKEQTDPIIEWIYSLQVHDALDEFSGFQGSSCFSFFEERTYFKCGFVAYTYFALSLLLILGDDYSRIQRKSIIKSRYTTSSRRTTRELIIIFI